MIKRHATAIALCELLPVPFVDTLIQNRIRRNLVRHQAREQGLELDADTLAGLADEQLDPMGRVLWWPLKKIASKVFFFVSPVLMVKTWVDAVNAGQSQATGLVVAPHQEKPGSD